MARKRFIVRRKGYTRRAHERRPYVRRDGTSVSGAHVRETSVRPSEFYITDRGAPGRGPRVVKRIRKGLMAQKASQYGLLEPGETIGDLTEAEARKLALKMAEDPEIGPRRSWRMFHVQTVFRKREPGQLPPFEKGGLPPGEASGVVDWTPLLRRAVNWLRMFTAALRSA